jgi:hypothetical protein
MGLRAAAFRPSSLAAVCLESGLHLKRLSCRLVKATGPAGGRSGLVRVAAQHDPLHAKPSRCSRRADRA